MYYYPVEFETRWDMLAYAAYGDNHRLGELMEANQEIALWNWIPAGIVIACPILLDAASSPAQTLPLWKQE